MRARGQSSGCRGWRRWWCGGGGGGASVSRGVVTGGVIGGGGGGGGDGGIGPRREGGARARGIVAEPASNVQRGVCARLPAAVPSV